MSDSLTVFGTDYTGVTGIKAKGTGNGMLTYIRPTGTKSISANGTGIDVAAYALVDVAVAGGGDSYTLTTVLAQRTLNPDSQHWAEVPASDWIEEPAVGEYYLVTFDGTEYLCTGGSMWDNEVVFGDDNNLFQNSNYMVPFAVDYSIQQKESTIGCVDTNQHTIKIERFEFVDGPLNLIAKSVTANGTYNASSDNADGYSSVTVNVPSGGGTYQAKTNINPTTSSQTILPDSGYDALSSVQINAMPSGTAGTPSATKGTVSNHSVSVTPKVTNTTGYITGGTKTGTAVTVSASELVSGSETKTANGTYNVTNLASLVVAIPIVTYHTSSSAPTSSQGSDGDLWLVTA